MMLSIVTITTLTTGKIPILNYSPNDAEQITRRPIGFMFRLCLPVYEKNYIRFYLGKVYILFTLQ